MISTMETVDLASVHQDAIQPRVESTEVERLNGAFRRMIARLETERREAGRAVIRAQERERRRIAQDLHDEVNQALTAHQLRPSVLDDHGLLPALQSQIRDFSDQTGIRTAFHARGTVPKLTPEQQLVIYRVTQESLSNIAQHAHAGQVDVELSFIGRTILRISDDGHGFTTSRNGGLGLSGMRERALLAGGHLSIWSGQSQGTRVELTIAQ